MCAPRACGGGGGVWRARPARGAHPATPARASPGPRAGPGCSASGKTSVGRAPAAGLAHPVLQLLGIVAAAPRQRRPLHRLRRRSRDIASCHCAKAHARLPRVCAARAGDGASTRAHMISCFMASTLYVRAPRGLPSSPSWSPRCRRSASSCCSRASNAVCRGGGGSRGGRGRGGGPGGGAAVRGAAGAGGAPARRGGGCSFCCEDPPGARGAGRSAACITGALRSPAAWDATHVLPEMLRDLRAQLRLPMSPGCAARATCESRVRESRAQSIKPCSRRTARTPAHAPYA